MARKKVKLQFIKDFTARKISYAKRKNSLIKNAKELSILCGVDLCVFLDGPYDPAPVVWPSSKTEAKRLLLKYEGTLEEVDHGQRRQTQEEFLKKSAVKLEDKIARLQSRNNDLEMENLMIDLLSGIPVHQVPFCNIEHLKWVINDKLRTFLRDIRKEGADADALAASPCPNPHPNLNNPLDNQVTAGTSAIMGGDGVVPFEAQAGLPQPFYYVHSPNSDVH